jgi:uncharacterized membrane protein
MAAPTPGATRSGERQGERSAASLAMDVAVGRLLRAGTLTAVAILAVGVVLLALAGTPPLEHPFPTLDAGAIPSDILALRPQGFLWLGLIAVILTPVSRVTASMVGYLRAGDRTMVVISLAVLLVLAASVVIAATLQ